MCVCVCVFCVLFHCAYINKVYNYLRKNYNYICVHILNLSGPSKAHRISLKVFHFHCSDINVCKLFSLGIFSLCVCLSFSLASIVVRMKTAWNSLWIPLACRSLYKQLVGFFFIFDFTAINQQIFSICNHRQLIVSIRWVHLLAKCIFLANEKQKVNN